MFLTVHAISGIAIATTIPNPLVSLPIAFASHFVIDSIPHWDYDSKSLTKFQINLAGASDLGLSLLLALGTYTSTKDMNLLGCIIFSSFMDLDAFLYHRVYSKGVEWRLFPSWLSRFHAYVHRKAGLRLGIATQVLVVILSLLIIYA